jgi:predicted RNase H-like HicB family nuclease
MRNEFTAIIETASEGGYFGYCLEIPGANGQGETIEECNQNLAAAIALILEDRREDYLRGVPQDAIRQIVSIG